MMSNRNHRPPTAKFREGTQPGIVLNQSAVTLLREDGANYVGVIFDDKRLKNLPNNRSRGNATNRKNYSTFVALWKSSNSFKKRISSCRKKRNSSDWKMN